MFMTSRHINITGLFLIMIALGFGYYLQYGLGLNPCILCVIQRICMMLVGGLLLAATVHYKNTIWSKRYLISGLVVLVVGLFAVGRQLYLQSLPVDESALCLPGMSFFWKTGAYYKAFKSLFMGSAECGKVDWSFLGVSLAGWSGLFLLGLFGLLMFSLWSAGEHEPHNIQAANDEH